MEEIKTRDDLKNALNFEFSVVMFGKDNCIHCTVAQKCIESIINSYPSIGFYHTTNTGLAKTRNVDVFPTLIFYENGLEQGRLVGSNHIHKIKDIINIWILK